MSGGKAGGGTQVYKHFMSMHIGLCAAGRGLRLLEIKFDEKVAWRGNLEANTDFDINKPDLFGGETKEGGVKGKVAWLNGNQNQTLPWRLAYRLGRAVDAVPGFRGLASIFLTGSLDEEGSNDEDTSFYMTANNPYLKKVSVRLRRPSEGLNPAIALIDLPDSPDGNAQKASNPGHIVFECMTNTDWGMGESLGAMDIGSFEVCAQTLYDEGLGLNMLWTRQSKIEEFIQEVLDHIQAAVFVHPETGKHTMKLLRNDYDPDLVPVVTPDNAQLRSYRTKSWGMISNEIVVTWTDPYNGKPSTVTAQDLAGIAMQGGIVSDSRNYYGVGSQETALQLAERDLAAVAYPYATCEAEVTREFWDAVRYDVVKLTWPEHLIEAAFFRVIEVSRGSTSRTITLTLTEDVFSLARSAYLTPAETSWLNTSAAPSPVEDLVIGTAPAYMTAISLGLTDITDLDYPDCISALLVAPNSTEFIDYDLVTYVTSTTGALTTKNLGVMTFQGYWTLAVALVAQASSTTVIPSSFIGPKAKDGDFLFIGNGDDDLTEIALIASKSGSTLTLNRGVLDTTPKAWPIGTPIWVVPANGIRGDKTIRSASEAVDYRLLARTSVGKLALADAPLVEVTLNERPHLPTRPAHVRVGGVGFGTFNMGADLSVDVTWKNRNRVTEATQVFTWTEASVPVEVGQTTVIQILKSSDRSVITTITGLTGETHTVARASFGGETDTIVRVIARRSGMDSLQGHEVRVTLS